MPFPDESIWSYMWSFAPRTYFIYSFEYGGGDPRGKFGPGPAKDQDREGKIPAPCRHVTPALAAALSLGL
jgi:hypothetical protein